MIKHQDTDHWKVLVAAVLEKIKSIYSIVGAMGAMNLFGIGTSKDLARAIECLRQASERGNVYVS